MVSIEETSRVWMSGWSSSAYSIVGTSIVALILCSSIARSTSAGSKRGMT